MELLSPVFLSDDGPRARLRAASDNIGLRVNKLYGWFSDKGRQLRSIAGNDLLVKALLSAEKAPVEGTRLPIGRVIVVYLADGSRRRLRICGVRSGGFSNAYTAIDLDEMKPYCLKENRATPGDEGKKNRDFATEAEISLRLGRHPHLVTTNAVFMYRSRLYMLTEYLPDESLDVRLKRTGPSFAEAIGYGLQICRAMKHACGVLPGFVHGDIKPGNCLLAGDGTLKLGDFGLSSANGVGKGSTADALTSGGGADARSSARGWGGTTPYMAPEMFDRRYPKRDAADVYAFGVTMFEMVCGRRPFRHESKSALIEMHRTADPPLERLRSEEVPESLVDLTARCLAKDPAARPQGFTELEGELELVAQDLGIKTASKSETGQTEDVLADAVARAYSFAAIGRSGAAVAAIDEVMASGVKTAELLAAKAIVCSTAHGLLEEAYEASTAALMMRADQFQVLFAHARVLAARGELERAEDYLRRAHTMEPANCPVVNILGRVCFGNGDPLAAAEYLKRSLAIDPAQPDALAELASVELHNGACEAAMRNAQKALAIDPSHPLSNTLMAEAHERAGDLPNAIKSYKNSLRTNPYSKRIRRRFVSACMAAHVSNDGSDHNGTAGFSLARSLVMSAALLQGRSTAQKASARLVDRFIRDFDRSGADARLLYYHDAALSKAADLSGWRIGRKLLPRLEAVRSKMENLPLHVQYSLGRVFYHLNDFGRCADVFATILQRSGPNESSYYYLAACAEVENDYAGALELYKKASQLLDTEDSRTGIRRMASRLGNGKNSSRRSSVHVTENE